MFKRRHEPNHALTVYLDGDPITAAAGDMVAAVLLASPDPRCRATPVSGSPRAPYCMMGVCFDCLMEIDGVLNRQACLVPVADGMRIRRQPRPEPMALT
ncbi:MAG: (2Fe-2S)-binding protein [Alphaproteobacteria bacterium]|nr:(2Fe-2S)-binding protein [Alphaproteobacteria bacterium]